MSKKLRPLADNILVKRFKNEGVTAGGIHVPETAQAKTQTGVVVAVGEGKLQSDNTLVAPKVKDGNIVVFGKYAGTELELEGEEFLILRESDILGVVENAEDFQSVHAQI